MGGGGQNMEPKNSLNLREHDRYFINEIPVEGIGTIVEVSRKGLKIRKAPDFTVEGRSLNFKLSTLELQTNVRWDDRNFMGLHVAGGFNDPKLIMNIMRMIKRPKETIVPPQMSVPEKAIQQYEKDEILTMMVNLLMEVDSPDPHISKIGIYIDEISALQKKNEAAAEKEKGDENTDEKAEEVTKKQLFLKDELIARAIALKNGKQSHSVKDVNFAINLLGYDRSVRFLGTICTKGFSSPKILCPCSRIPRPIIFLSP